MSRLSEILERYSLKQETAAAVVDAVVRFNRSNAAEEIGVSRETVYRYQKAFRDMTECERRYVLDALTASFRAEGEVERAWISARSAGGEQ